MTNEGKFGLLVDSFSSDGQARFQLIVDGRLIGDEDPCLAYGAFEELGDLPRFTDSRLGLLDDNRDLVLSSLLVEEELHDPSTLPLAESLDGWLIQGYIYEGNAVLIARSHKNGSLSESPLISVVNGNEYDSVIAVARAYWGREAGPHVRSH